MCVLINHDNTLTLDIRRLGRLGVASHRYQVDAVSVTTAVRQVVTQVGSRGANGFPILETSHVFPYHFFISKRRPSMTLTLTQELIHGSTYWGFKQGYTRDAIVESNWLCGFLGLSNERCALPISCIFSPVSVEVANSVSKSVVAAPLQILLHRFFGGPMTLLVHGAFISKDGVLRVG